MNIATKPCLGLLGIAIGLAVAAPANADAVIDWNAVFDANGSLVGSPPDKAYLGALMHIAIHDALNNIDPRYETYTVARPAAAYASPDAAIAAAGHDVLYARLGCATPIPARLAACGQIAALYNSSLNAIPDGAAKTAGMDAGRNAAHDILQLREGDGSDDDDPPYTNAPAPGIYQPTAPNFPVPAEAHFGMMKPFAMNSSSQFRSDPGEIFNLTGEVYTRDYNEVKRVGSLAVRAAAPDSAETDIARFWPAGGSNWNATARIIVANRGMHDPWPQARLLALMNIATIDGLIQVFDTKYTYTFWRPVTAIHWTGNYGNPATPADPSWMPFFSFPGGATTPPYPDYTCGLPTGTGANAEVLRRYYGTDTVPFSRTVALAELKSPAVPPPGTTFPTGYWLPAKTITRSYARLSQAEQEAASARVYAGIHFRSGCTLGLTKGEQVGRFVFEHYLRPLK